jgi:hypothetical protein
MTKMMNELENHRLENISTKGLNVRTKQKTRFLKAGFSG